MTHHIHPLENCLARILVKNTDLQPLPSGAGVALHGGRVLTCAHVVNAALGLPNNSHKKPEEIITVDFPLSGSKEKITAKVGFWDYETDLAELIMIESLPSEVKPVYLHSSDELWDHRVQVFGFPSKNLNGAWADCQLRGHNTLGWVEIFDPNTTGNFIQQGFSGGPVWDSNVGGVIGIVVAIDKNVDARIGYLIPANKIAEKWINLPKQHNVKNKPESNNLPERLLKVFLCHASTDKPAVRELYNKLVSSEVDVWLDEKKLLAGQKWDIEIQKAVRNADVVIICLSKTSITKEGYVQKEIKFSMDIALEKPEDTIYLIPVRLEKCKVPKSLSEYQWVDLFETNSYQSLINSLIARASQLGFVKKPSLGNQTTATKKNHPRSVGRRGQLDKFTEVLNRIEQQGFISSNLLEWYGSPGIGKTVLVYMLAQKAEEQNAIYALVDFKQSPSREYFKDPVLLIENIVYQLSMQVVLDADEFASAVGRYGMFPLPEYGVVQEYLKMNQQTRLQNPPDWLVELQNTVIVFINLINSLSLSVETNGVRPVVLFFDETDHASTDLIDWIEEWVIKPLIQIKHCAVVWTARRPWRWKRPEIRRRLTSEMLSSFEPTMVKKQIQEESNAPNLVKDLFENIYWVTGGHPFANSIVIQEIDGLIQQGNNITIDTFSDFEPEILVDVFNKFIKEYAFLGLDPLERIACKYAALVRLVDTTMLREILSSCAADSFSSWTQERFYNLLHQLRNTQLLFWEKGFILDPNLSHIIQRYLMVLERNTFIRVNQVALKVYGDWLAKPVDNRSLFVLEELYHNAILFQIGEHVDLGMVLRKRLEEYPLWIKDKNALNDALDRLEKEINNDKELEQLTGSEFRSWLARQVLIFKYTGFST